FWILYWAKQDGPVVLDGGICGKGTNMVMETNNLHLFNIHFTMKLTYKTLPCDDDIEVLNSESEIVESGQDGGSDNRNKLQWDDGCPWSEWYTAEDPLKGNIL
ncbi:Rab3 GTPase-activating protein catalytic subunit, partial [Tanacetum coccineum]